MCVCVCVCVCVWKRGRAKKRRITMRNMGEIGNMKSKVTTSFHEGVSKVIHEIKGHIKVLAAQGILVM